MAEDGKADNEVFVFVADAVLRKCVKAHEGVVPDVPLRMPLRVLPAPDQAGELREIIDPARRPEEAKPGAYADALEE